MNEFNITVKDKQVTIKQDESTVSVIDREAYDIITDRISRILHDDEAYRDKNNLFDRLSGKEIALMFIAIENGADPEEVSWAICKLTVEERWWLYDRLHKTPNCRKAIANILSAR